MARKTAASAAASVPFDLGSFNMGGEAAAALLQFRKSHDLEESQRLVNGVVSVVRSAGEQIIDVCSNKRRFDQHDVVVVERSVKSMRGALTRLFDEQEELARKLASSGLITLLDKHQATLLGCMYDKSCQASLMKAETEGAGLPREMVQQMLDMLNGNRAEIESALAAAPAASRALRHGPAVAGGLGNRAMAAMQIAPANFWTFLALLISLLEIGKTLAPPCVEKIVSIIVYVLSWVSSIQVVIADSMMAPTGWGIFLALISCAMALTILTWAQVKTAQTIPQIIKVC